MKLLSGMLLLGLLASACQSRSDLPTEANKPDTTYTPEPKSTDSIPTASRDSAAAAVPVEPSVRLALTSNALQLVNAQTGSTNEIPLGRPFEPLVATLTTVLQQPPANVGVNEECGAGPLKMATWPNGLTLAFQQKAPQDAAADSAASREWQFVGWSLNPTQYSGPALITMAGIGLGSTRAEMESAYVIKVVKSSLGYEFSTSAGLYGLFDGMGSEARITAMWSGTSCVFR